MFSKFPKLVTTNCLYCTADHDDEQAIYALFARFRDVRFGTILRQYDLVVLTPV